MNITDKVFSKLQARDQESFVLKVWAPWNESCKNMAPAYNSAAQSFNGDVRFLKLNYQKYRAVSDQLDVREIPALFLYNHGMLVTQMSGVLSEKSLIEWVKAGLDS